MSDMPGSRRKAARYENELWRLRVASGYAGHAGFIPGVETARMAKRLASPFDRSSNNAGRAAEPTRLRSEVGFAASYSALLPSRCAADFWGAYSVPV